MQADSPSGMTPTEVWVAEIWASELGAVEVRPESDFFELGGDSLLMLNMLFRVSQKLGVDIQAALLFEEPTLRGFCRRVDLEACGTCAEPTATDMTAGVI